MQLKNIRFVTNPSDLELGEPQVYNRVPIKTVTYEIRNEGNTTDTKVATLTYDETESWSKEENFSFSETIGITNTYEFDLGVMLSPRCPGLKGGYYNPLSFAARYGARTVAARTTSQMLPPLNVYASSISGQVLPCQSPNVNSKTSVSASQPNPSDQS